MASAAKAHSSDCGCLRGCKLEERIIAVKQREVREAQAALTLADAEKAAKATLPVRDFAGALRAKIAVGKAAVISEIKKASPSRGVLRDPFSNKPYVMFYTTKRVGGGVQDYDAIKLLKFGTV